MPGKAKPKVTIYTTPTCPVCRRAKEYLAQKGVVYEEIDVVADRRAATEMVQKSGQMGVPVIVVDDKILVGFNSLKLDIALKLNK